MEIPDKIVGRHVKASLKKKVSLLQRKGHFVPKKGSKRRLEQVEVKSLSCQQDTPFSVFMKKTVRLYFSLVTDCRLKVQVIFFCLRRGQANIEVRQEKLIAFFGRIEEGQGRRWNAQF